MKKLLLLILLSIPGFVLMLKTGIYTMHDFHAFRQLEFTKCISEGIFPCRWAPDAGMGFGEPLFNFYGQFPYWIGQAFIFSGLSIIDAVKLTFILSLSLSGLSMYLLAHRFWGPTGALVSAIFYMYAPYRAVDVWVRGALPEALAFVFFPLILFFLETKKFRLFALSLALLVITHNLSLYMFLPFLGIWWLFRSRDLKIVPAGLVSLLLAAFYLLPVSLESTAVTLSQITSDYYSYPLHYTSISQLFISRFWGYGGSTWGPNDTMSFSVGHLHWILVLVIGFFVLFKRDRLLTVNYSLFTLLAVLALFLTHGKSELLWKTIPGLPYVQFPWRFLTMSTLFFSLTAGMSVRFLSRKLIPYLLLLLLLINHSFFRPDIWKSISDAEAFSGRDWNEQRSSALSDYWPKSSPSLPNSFAPGSPWVNLGDAMLVSSRIFSHSSKYHFRVDSSYAKLTFPIVYFPGWIMTLNGGPLAITPSDELGLISARIPQGNHQVELKFKDTPPRVLGNGISLISLAGLIFWQKKHVPV